MFAFGLSFLALLALNRYHASLGPLSISAGALFKPLLLLDGAFLALALLARRDGAGPADAPPRGSLRLCALGVMAAAILCHFPSIFVNISDPGWDARQISAAIDGIRGLGGLFVNQQADGFYRPLGFASLWADYFAFGRHSWAYHLQNLCLHAANAALVVLTAAALGFRRGAAVWAGLLFAAGSVTFEAVLWPAARFDLLATFFSLLALLFLLRFISGRTGLLAASVCFAAALLSKESAYALPLIAAFLALTWTQWRAERPPRSRKLAAVGALGAVTLLALAVRLAIYGGLTGYRPAAGGELVHTGLGAKTVTSLFMRLPLGLFGINTGIPIPVWMRAAAAAFALALLALAAYRTPALSFRERALPALVLLTAVPTLNIILWVSPAMQHARFLYFPAVWLSILLAAAAWRHPWRAVLLPAVLAANAAAATHNLGAYRNAMTEFQRIAAEAGGIREVVLCNTPREPRGVFFFRSELVRTLERAGARVELVTAPHCPAAEAGRRAVYVWPEGRLIRGD